MMNKFDKIRKETIYYMLIGLLLWQIWFFNNDDFEQFPWYLQYIPLLIFAVMFVSIIIIVIVLLIFWDGYDED